MFLADITQFKAVTFTKNYCWPRPNYHAVTLTKPTWLTKHTTAPDQETWPPIAFHWLTQLLAKNGLPIHTAKRTN